MELRTGTILVQRGQLVLTPRMQQALRVLQSPQPELAVLLREALTSNPFLEEESAEESTLAVGVDPREVSASVPAGPAVSPGEDHLTVRGGQDRFPAVAMSGRGWDDRAWAERIPDQAERWRERLVSQVRSRANTSVEIRLTEFILGCLDDRGYLGLPVGEIADATGVRPEQVETVRLEILKLDPPGLASTNLVECLRAQLAHRGRADSLAVRMLGQDLRLLAGRRYQDLAGRLGVDETEVRAAAKEIRSLWPYPASQLQGVGEPGIYPDLRVEEVGGQWEVFVNDRLLPKVRLAPPSKEALRQGGAETRAFVTEGLARARWLLGSLDARRRTLVRLMRLILEEQRGFFDEGVAALRPLGYRRIAALMGLHESTIARAVRDKYVETPQGLYPLRFFFSQGLDTRSGDRRASAAIAHKIREIIKGESEDAPLPDEEVARRLRREGVRIARRTVAKYRDRMDIPKAAFRRRG